MKRNRSTDGFSLSKRQIKRMKVSKPSAGNIGSNVEQSATISSTSTTSRDSTKKFTWGSSDDTTAGFSGIVPDAFVYRCSLETEESVIKNHLSKKGLKIKNVELKSHKNAATKSFKVSVETLDDFEKLVSGQYIPKCVKVRKYIYFKHKANGKVMSGRASSAPSSMDHPIRDNDLV